MSRGPLLVTGGTGYLGGEVLRQAARRAPVATHLRASPSTGRGSIA